MTSNAQYAPASTPPTRIAVKSFTCSYSNNPWASMWFVWEILHVAQTSAYMQCGRWDLLSCTCLRVRAVVATAWRAGGRSLNLGIGRSGLLPLLFPACSDPPNLSQQFLHHSSAHVAFRKSSILDAEHASPVRSSGPPSPPCQRRITDMAAYQNGQ